MKPIINLILLFYSFICFSQIDSLNFYYQKKDFRKAIYYGEKLERDSDFIKNKLNLITIKSNNGVMYNLIGEYNQASKKFEDVLLLMNNEPSISNLEISIIKKQAARNLEVLGEFTKAKKLINESLEIFKLNKKVLLDIL
jgi:tetratricopeptide (TPR) repeat protein